MNPSPPANGFLDRARSWISYPAVRVGFSTGIALSIVFVVSVLAACRIPVLDRFALYRNVISVSLFATIMLLPIGRFLKSPKLLFYSGIFAWSLFSLVYLGMGGAFENLFARLRTPGTIFACGAISYAWIAVAVWVVPMFGRLRSPAPAPRQSHARTLR